MAGSDSDQEKKPEQGGEKKPLGGRLRDWIEGVLEDLQSLLDPPQPVRVPIPAGPRRPR